MTRHWSQRSDQLIHRFWAGQHDMPEEYQEFGRQWQALNPGYEVIDWDIRCLVDFKNLKPVFDDLFARDGGRHGIELYVQIADVIGYALVERYGGAYFNCDIQPVRPLSELKTRDIAWASLENNEDGRVVNAAIGAPHAHDQFWVHLLRELPHRYFANPTAEMVETTGPALLTDMANLYPEQITVFPVHTFNGVHWKQIDPGSDASAHVEGLAQHPGVIGVHHWGHKRDGRSNRVETATQ